MTNPATGKDGKTYKLTLKQENFCRAYLECEGNASAAYRQVYGCKGWSDEAVWCAASKLMSNAKVQQRIEELQQAAQKRHDVTVDSLTDDLRAAYDLAKKNDQSAAMTQAALGIAKLHGMLVDKQQQLEPRTVDMTPDALDEELERVRAKLAALERPAGSEVPRSLTEH